MYYCCIILLVVCIPLCYSGSSRVSVVLGCPFCLLWVVVGLFCICIYTAVALHPVAETNVGLRHRKENIAFLFLHCRRTWAYGASDPATNAVVSQTKSEWDLQDGLQHCDEPQRNILNGWLVQTRVMRSR